MKPLSIYIHIPFCVKKCFYCDFLSAEGTEKEQEIYIKSLCLEIKEAAKEYQSYAVRTVFIGGGTPSSVCASGIEKILEVVKQAYTIESNCEITMEANPGTVTREKLMCYRRAGINRLSIGLQSANNKELAVLGRVHTWEEFCQTYQDAVDCGFKNINVDLIFSIPEQTMESYQETLKKVMNITPKPTHLSPYSLMIEEGTPFYTQELELSDEDTEREMDQYTEKFLGENKYERYEISNYALDGHACIHNQVYWDRGDYVGFGVGAVSMIGNRRFQNIKNNDRYSEVLHEKTHNVAWNELQENEQILSRQEQMEEFMFLGLRLTRGINCNRFSSLFGQSIEEVYPNVVETMIRQEVLMQETLEDGSVQLFLTAYGRDVSNVVMSAFLLSV